MRRSKDLKHIPLIKTIFTCVGTLPMRNNAEISVPDDDVNMQEYAYLNTRYIQNEL